MSTHTRRPLSILHRIAGVMALLLIATFWISTVTVELRGNIAEIVMVKTAVAYGLLVLIPCLITTGASGFRLSGGKKAGLLGVKLRRMKIIAANGVLFLMPCAISLALMAQQGRFDAVFAIVQGIELLAGAINIYLIGRNIRDGIRLARPAGILSN